MTGRRGWGVRMMRAPGVWGDVVAALRGVPVNADATGAVSCQRGLWRAEKDSEDRSRPPREPTSTGLLRVYASCTAHEAATNTAARQCASSRNGDTGCRRRYAI